MKLYLTVNHKQHQLTFEVKSAVYLDMTVYQIDSGDINALIYQEGDHWAVTNNVEVEPELLDKIGAAILKQSALEYSDKTNS